MAKHNKFWHSASTNNKTYIDIYQQLAELALNMFEWKNLPDTVDERFLELTLYEKGYCLYFNDPIIGNLTLPCTIGGNLDVYRIPIRRRAYATNGYNLPRDSSNSIIIFNNYLHTPSLLTVEMFTNRIYNIQRAIDCNINQQKFPFIIACDESQRLTMENLMMKYEGNIPFIFANKDMDLTDIKVLKTDVPLIAEKLQIVKHQIWNEALTFFGIENSNQDKKERLVADEVGSNYGNVEAQRNVMLNARRQAVDKINKMFGTNIGVTFRSSLQTTANAENISESREVQK